MKNSVLYKISILGLLIILFTLSYVLGSFVYGEDYFPDEEISSTQEAPRRSTPQSAEATGKYYNVPLTKEEQDFVCSVCREYNLPVKFAYAIMKVESDYNAEAVAGEDYGIMQINKINHEDMCRVLNIDNFLDFYDNTKCGVYLLAEYFNKYNDYSKAAMCYHFGRSGAGEFWSQGIYSTPYTEAVLDAMNYIIVDNDRYQ